VAGPPWEDVILSSVRLSCYDETPDLARHLLMFVYGFGANKMMSI